jgi:hypothetical protein
MVQSGKCSLHWNALASAPYKNIATFPNKLYEMILDNGAPLDNDTSLDEEAISF